MVISKAGTEDIPRIREMAEVVFRETYREILSPEQMEYMMDMMYSEANLRKQMEASGHQFFIAEKDGKPVGYVSVSFEGGKLWHLQKLYVLPEFQGLGIGRAMLLEAENYIRESCPQGARMELNVNRHNKAVGFYEKMGMEKARQGDFPIGNGFFMNDYIMAIDL